MVSRGSAHKGAIKMQIWKERPISINNIWKIIFPSLMIYAVLKGLRNESSCRRSQWVLVLLVFVMRWLVCEHTNELQA